MNPGIRRQVSRRKGRQPSGDIFFLKRESLSGKQDERIEDGAPGDMVLVQRIIKRVRPDGVFREDQRPVPWIPDGKCPISEELRKAASSPPFVRCGNDGKVGRSNAEDISQLADELRA